MEKIRIAVLAPIHWRTPPQKFGPWELVASQHTEELVRRGHEVTLYATSDSVTKASLRWVAPHALFEEGGKSLDATLYKNLHAAAVFEEAHRFDIIHNHNDALPLAMSRLVKTPVVSTVHAFTSPQVHRLYLQYDNVHYVSISHALRQQCPQMHWVANVYHGIDTRTYEFSPRAEQWLGFIGRIHPDKGAHLAIDAAKRAGRELRIAGPIDNRDPQVRRYWAEQIEPLIDDRQIRYVGELGGHKKVEFYRAAKAILAPIRWEEPFGLTLIEAMAAGTPVIAFGRGSVPEVVRHEVSGLIVPPDDVAAMADAVQRIDSLERAAVRAHVEANFTIESMVDGYEAVYARVLGLQ